MPYKRRSLSTRLLVCLLLPFLSLIAIPALSLENENDTSEDEELENAYLGNDDLDNDEGFYYEDAFSDQEYTDTRPFVTIETLLGGQTLERIEFENGESDSIRAGSGVYIALGVAHLMFEQRMDIGIKAGYLFDLVTAKDNEGNQSVLSFTRKPIDIFSHYWVDRHCWGGGLTAHLDPIFTSRETSHNAKYDNAYGAYAEYLFHFVGTGSALGVKYLHINYKNKETDDVSDGSAWGITFNQLF
ncbi:MAG: hypothetical protein V7765_06900 [Oleispira sp.]